MHIYIYIRAVRMVRRKSSNKVVNLYSLVSGYVILSFLLYILPLFLAATGAIEITDNDLLNSKFVENNRDFLVWVLSLDLPGDLPPQDWLQYKNAVNIYYLTLAMFVSALAIVLSVPIIWPLSLGWSNYMDSNPEKYATSTKFYALFLGIGMCAYILNALFRQVSYGYSMHPAGSFMPFDQWDWQREVFSWSLPSFTVPVLFALSIGAALSLTKSKEKKNV